MSVKQRSIYKSYDFKKHSYDHKVTDLFIFDYLSAIDSPLSLSVWLLYLHNEHDQIVLKEIDHKSYNSVESFRDDYQAVRFLSKAKFLKLSVDPKLVAIQKYNDCEKLNAITNRAFVNRTAQCFKNNELATCLHGMTRKIHSILGSTPSAEEFIKNTAWGPGSTLSVKKDTSSNTKYRFENGITSDLFAFMKPWFSAATPLYASYLRFNDEDHNMLIQDSNTLTFAPKNAKTHRAILIQPGFNLFFQKSLGSSIRTRLKQRAHIDLRSKAQEHLLICRQSSRDGKRVSVDFSSASDTICTELIREVSPHDWFCLLDVARCKTRLPIKGESFRYITEEKFSAMGNGFTFELESLIFFAAACAVTEYLGLDEREVSIFGDDVFINKEAYPLFIQFCESLGFTVNKQKTCSDGWFRESCGSYFYAGCDVKPLYLKDRISNVSSIFKLVNGVRRVSHSRNFNYGCSIRFHRTWLNLRDRIPKPLRFCTPSSLGDVGISSNFDEYQSASRVDKGFIFYLHEKPISYNDDSSGLLFLRLREIKGGLSNWTDIRNHLQSEKRELTSTLSGNRYNKRDRVCLKLGITKGIGWYDFGPWF